jgi:hypothetical protein
MRLPCRSERLANEAGGRQDGPSPCGRAGAVAVRREIVFVSACHSRAISSGNERYHRTTTVNPGESLSWMIASDLRVCKAEKVHGMQEVSTGGWSAVKYASRTERPRQAQLTKASYGNWTIPLLRAKR